MIIIDQILQWARNNGYTAVYGSQEQVNEMLTDVPFADSENGTVVVMHLISSSETVDGHDRATLAVYFASLCDFDFDGESLLPEQERLKSIGKELLNDIRTGNVLSYADPRWQYGYDDYAENVAWVCLRVTLTALAADCVPMSPEPTPQPWRYDLLCPQIIVPSQSFLALRGQENPIVYKTYPDVLMGALVTFAVKEEVYSTYANYTPWIGNQNSPTYTQYLVGVISESLITTYKNAMAGSSFPMNEETEKWLRDRTGRRLITRYLQKGGAVLPYTVIVVAGASNHESKDAVEP